MNAIDGQPLNRLLEETWAARDARAPRREAVVEAAATALFVVAAAALFGLSGTAGTLDLGTAALMVGLYVAVARVEFPIGAGSVVPTQLVLLPMLAVVPPGAVPALVAAGLLLAAMIDWRLGRIGARRVLSAVPDAWHAIGPAVVLLAAGSPELGLDDLPLIAAAFAACCLVDLASAMLRALASRRSDLALHARVLVRVWAVDACLIPGAFLVGVAAEHHPATALFVLPLAALLALLTRDRNEHIDQARRRLELVEHERARLRSAVRRLGDAFAAKLDLDGLLDILLRGSAEAVDAADGRLELLGASGPRVLTTGAPVPIGRAETLTVPITIVAGPKALAGELRLVRDARPFEDDEVALVGELVAKAQLAAAETLAHEALRDQALTDPLTGLGNRRRLSRDLAASLDRASDGSTALLLLFDLDGFKAYNDTFGHLAGDALLTRLGGKLAEAVGPQGDAYRLGGDELCALVRLDGADVDALIARTAGALAEDGDGFAIGASLGVVVLPHEADSADHALQLADDRMYADKRGRPSGPRDQARDVLLRTMQAKQPDLDEHSAEVADLARRVAHHLGATGEELDEIVRAAELHDVGKVGIPDEILNKPAALDPDEWEFMRQHTILGERILNAAPALRPVARLVRLSHEHWDGAGYPDGLRGEEIPLGARIVAVCDAYEAMTADRPYRRAIGHAAACRELRAMAGRQFDPAVVEAFLTVLFDDRADPRLSAVSDAGSHVRALLEART